MIEVVLRVRIAQPCVVCDEGSESFPSSPLPPPPRSRTRELLE